MARTSWFAVRRELPPHRRALLQVCAFLLPLAAWCVVSYVPWIWHPLMRVTVPGGSDFLTVGMMVERGAFADENVKLVTAGKAIAEGERANPVFLPPPHAVARALYTGFTTPPVRRGEPWLHQSLLHSISVIAWGFGIAVLIGVPLGILCGSLRAVAQVVEPFVDFIRYMPAPAFGALAVAVFGIDDQPKIAIIVIATLFTTILVVANTARQVDHALLEAAQTLGARDRQLLTNVIIPGMLPQLYQDLRIMLGCAWTALIVAELIGASSGISQFINQQGKYRNYDNVFAGIILIGLIGLVTDQVLAFIGRFLFSWQSHRHSRTERAIWQVATWPLRLAGRAVGVGWRTARRPERHGRPSQNLGDTAEQRP